MGKSMATQGIEQVTENAIRAVARDCGSLSMECSDVAGYVRGVSDRIGDHLKMLDGLEEVTTRLLAVTAVFVVLVAGIIGTTAIGLCTRGSTRSNSCRIAVPISSGVGGVAAAMLIAGQPMRSG